MLKFNKQVFAISLFIIGLMMIFSFVIAFAYDEGTHGNEIIGQIGHYTFIVLKFPSHNLIWLNENLIGILFFPGLVFNLLFHAGTLTLLISNLHHIIGRKLNV
jgi:hypothetical protein